MVYVLSQFQMIEKIKHFRWNYYYYYYYFLSDRDTIVSLLLYNSV